jgi:hypothetical protein
VKCEGAHGSEVMCKENDIFLNINILFKSAAVAGTIIKCGTRWEIVFSVFHDV